MIAEQKDEIRYRVAKCLASDELNNRRAYFDADYNLQRLKGPDLEDARCLLRMIVKEVEAHNAALKTKESLLRNLRYSRTWMTSKLFSGLNIPYRKIDELITANPEADYYAIYKKMIGR